MKKKIYISGPISGHDLEARRRVFSDVAKTAAALGFEPVSPFDNGVPEDAPWEDHMRADIKMLLDCHAILMLPGWKDSKGACTELIIANTLNMQTFKV